MESEAKNPFREVENDHHNQLSSSYHHPWPFLIPRAILQTTLLPRKFFMFFGFHPAQRKHKFHRVGGFLFLVQYFYSIYLYLFSYDKFATTAPFVWSMPLNGWIQAVSASLTFTFLPRKKEPGYTAFGDVGAISYFYVVENTFFSLLLLFAWCYYSKQLFPWIRSLWILELVFVFLPYLPIIRFQWPVSSFRDALATMDKGMSPANKRFFVVSTYVVKYFYIFAKHYVGFFVNCQLVRQ